jgi:hypothetical protein
MKQHIKTVKELQVWGGNQIALDEVVKAAERYELVRTITAMQFKTLCQNNIYEDDRFDDLVDEMIEARK